MDTSIENVKLLAPELSSSLSTEKFNLLLSDAKIEISKYNIPDEIQERTQRYLIAHYASMSNPAINKRKVKDLELSYNTFQAGDDLESTTYGKEVKRLLALYAVSTKARTTGTIWIFS